VKKVKKYVPLMEALEVDWTNAEFTKKLKKMDSSYFLMLGKPLLFQSNISHVIKETPAFFFSDFLYYIRKIILCL